MTKDEPICMTNCSPCEWFGICPHSYPLLDESEDAKKAEAELFGEVEE